MKSSVSVFIMLMMVLGFVINAFADANVEALNNRLNALIADSANGIIAGGHTAGGRYCELSLDSSNDANKTPAVSIFFGGMFGEGMWNFSTMKNSILSFSDEGSKLVVNYADSSGRKQKLVLELETQNDKQVLKAAEFFEEKTSLFGNTSMKSGLRCNI